MDQEQSWITTQTIGEDDNTAATNYNYFMRPEPRDNLGPIREADDPYLGKTKVRDLRIGMVRNASEENKKAITAYLTPYPHTRIDSAKPLQGWYQSKINESAQSRPRPCFTEAVLTEPYGGWCLPGGSLVETPLGGVPIESLRQGDIIIGQRGGRLTSARVLGTISRVSISGLVTIRTKQGDSVPLTAEHPVYSLSRSDYVPAGELYAGETIETRSLQELRDSCQSVEGQRTSDILSGLSLSSEENGGARSGSIRPRSSRLGMYKRGLRERMPYSVVSSLFGLRSQSAAGSRTKQEGEAYREEGYPQNSGNKSKARCGADREEAYSGDSCQVRGASETRYHRAETIKEGSVYLPQGASLSSQIVVGEVGSRDAGREGVGLGVRTRSDSTTRWNELPAGLQTIRRNVYRGQGIYGPSRQAEDRPSERARPDRRSLRCGEDERSGVVVETVDTDTTPVIVYDIETTTHNFYVRGQIGNVSYHVHNCAVGCSFCYVNSGFRGYRGTGLITVPLEYGYQIGKQLRSVRRAAAGYFSSFTDPFTPLEAYYHNTQQAAEEFVKVGLPLFFLSRLRYPKWAIDLLKINPHSYAQKSINTSNPDDWKRLSPGALGYKSHLGDIARIKREGIYVSIQCNPILPGVTSHEDIRKLFRDLARAGADHVIVKFVEAGYSWAPAMVERTIRRFGARGEAFAELFTQNIGSQRTIDQTYRLEAHERYSAWAKQYGLTYATCYEYEYEKNPDGSIKSKTGVSIGRKYTTAAQCHGHAVPVYMRNSEAEQFRPVEECPPSGCLYCADENEGKPRCGDELAGEATAVRAADLKLPIGKGKGRTIELPVIGG